MVREPAIVRFDTTIGAILQNEDAAAEKATMGRSRGQHKTCGMRANDLPLSAQLVCVVADDHADMRAALSSVLADEGFTVVDAVATGREAVRGLTTHRPDFAVIDVRLDDMSGSAVARAAAELGLDTAIVIHTAEASAALVAEALASGAQAVARKAVPPTSLLAGITTAVQGGIYVDPAFPMPRVGEAGPPVGKPPQT
jgi:DNA-binding NarL/FixJ family response regulator